MNATWERFLAGQGAELAATHGSTGVAGFAATHALPIIAMTYAATRLIDGRPVRRIGRTVEVRKLRRASSFHVVRRSRA